MLTLIPNLEVSIEHCNRCCKPTEDAYSSGHLVLSHLGLAFVLMLSSFFPELVMSMDLSSFEHPSVLLFCFIILQNYWYTITNITSFGKRLGSSSAHTRSNFRSLSFQEYVSKGITYLYDDLFYKLRKVKAWLFSSRRVRNTNEIFIKMYTSI